ncbi:MAG: hypothetical protein ACI3YK_00215 [Eubacteriales bacterium]
MMNILHTLHDRQQPFLGLLPVFLLPVIGVFIFFLLDDFGLLHDAIISDFQKFSPAE